MNNVGSKTLFNPVDQPERFLPCMMKVYDSLKPARGKISFQKD
jgi:hypothetical protein